MRDLLCLSVVMRAQILTGDNRITQLGDKRLPQGSIIDFMYIIPDKHSLLPVLKNHNL